MGVRACCRDLEQYPELFGETCPGWLLTGKDEVAIKATHGKVLTMVGSLQLSTDDPLEGLLAQRVESK